MSVSLIASTRSARYARQRVLGAGPAIGAHNGNSVRPDLRPEDQRPPELPGAGVAPSAIDHDVGAGDPGRPAGEQEGDYIGDFLGGGRVTDGALWPAPPPGAAGIRRHSRAHDQGYTAGLTRSFLRTFAQL